MRTPIAAVLSVLACITITACSDDNTTNPTDTQGSSMKATVDGKAWTAVTASATKNQSQIAVSGVAADGSGITLGLYNVTAAGDVGLGSSLSSGTYSANQKIYSTMYTSSNAGTVKVTTLDATHIAGSFTFTATGAPGQTTGTVSVTSGTFNAKF